MKYIAIAALFLADVAVMLIYLMVLPYWFPVGTDGNTAASLIGIGIMQILVLKLMSYLWDYMTGELYR